MACAGASSRETYPEDLRQGTYYEYKGARLFTRGCYANALDYFQDAHEHYTLTDQPEGVARSLKGIADIYYRRGDMPSALLIYEDVIEIYRFREDLPGAVQALCSQAAALTAMDRPDEADAVLSHADRLDAGMHRALRLKTRALLLIKKKQMQQAEDLLKKALSAADENDKALLSGIYYSMGYLDLAAQRPTQAGEKFARALNMDQTAAAYHDVARDLEGLGTSYANQGDHLRALNYFKRSAKIYALLKDSHHAQTVAAQLEISAAQANADVQATLYWVRQWMDDSKGADLCD